MTDKTVGQTIKVTLGRLFAAKDQWAKLAKIPKSPKIAFKIAKFMRRVLEEHWQIIEEQRNQYIIQFSTSPESEPPGVDGKKDPKKLQAFVETFNEYLGTEIEIKKIDVKFEELIDAMEANKGTVIDELVLMEIEDFFLSEEALPDKKAKPKARKPKVAA